MFENISHSYNLTHSKNKNSHCVAVFVFSESKDNVLLETVGSVQLDIAVKGGRSNPILITGGYFKVTQNEPAIAHRCCQVCKLCAIPSKSEWGYLLN